MDRPIFELFKDVYPDYKEEFLIKLLKSKYFCKSKTEQILNGNEKGAGVKVDFASLSDKEKLKYIPKKFLEKIDYVDKI